MDLKERVRAFLDKQPVMLSVKDVARILGCSTRHVYRMSDSGKMPAPIKLGALVKWRAEDVATWMDAGCPAVRK